MKIIIDPAFKIFSNIDIEIYKFIFSSTTNLSYEFTFIHSIILFFEVKFTKPNKITYTHFFCKYDIVLLFNSSKVYIKKFPNLLNFYK